MGIFNAFKTLVSPKHAEFTKRLIAKRKSLAENSLFAGIASSGTAIYNLRQAGLGGLEYALTPEATMVHVLEKYWETYSFSHAFYSDAGLSQYHSDEQKAKKSGRRLSFSPWQD